MTRMTDHSAPVGTLLRDWRTRRRRSQLDLASDAGISARHLSFVETGRSRPSREMVLHLAEHLDVPLRARNALLIAAGFAPTYHATDLDAPEMQTVRAAIERVLEGHEPFPAILVDRRWELVAANNAAALLTDGVKPDLLEPPCNVLRASLHPEGLGPRIVNLSEWSEHIIGGLRRQIAVTGDEELRALEEELFGLRDRTGCTATAADRVARRDRDPAAAARRGRRASVHHHDRDVRNCPRCHARGARHRSVPSRGRRDREGAVRQVRLTVRSRRPARRRAGPRRSARPTRARGRRPFRS